MNRTLIGIVVVAFVYFGLAGQALAEGFGGYLEGGLGNGEFEYDSSGDFDVDPTAGGFGLVFDTDLTDRGSLTIVSMSAMKGLTWKIKPT